ncbi:unnamed protein product [Calicophoron daubneyi]|uniref:Protein regulator of cytokinesis 1 n=1 Tax=Calicophoron daubneyi TaxID=300641 RepID=A0AAV2T6J6_CALDB
MAATEALEQTIANSLRASLNELTGIWDYVGYDDTERTDHTRCITAKLQSALNEIIADENSARLKMEHDIECKRREVADLCQQLRIPSYLPERGLTSSGLMKALKNKSDELATLKQNRFEQYARMRSRALRLSHLLNESSDVGEKRIAAFPPLQTQVQSEGDKPDHALTPDRIPEEREISALKEICDRLDSRYGPLAAQHATLRADIGRVASDIQYQPQNDREAELLKAIGLSDLCTHPAADSTPGVVRKLSEAGHPKTKNDVNNKPDGALSSEPYEPVVDDEILKWLTDWRLRIVKEKARLVGTCDELRAYLATMWHRLDKPELEQTAFLEQHSGYRPDTLDALQEEVDRCQQMKWEKLDTYLARLTDEATRLARVCCLDESIVQLPPNQDAGDPEVVANHLETVLEQLNHTYSLYRPIYEAIAVYEDSWQNLMDVEMRLKDPAIFSNRGGILLKTEKEKKRIMKDVQHAEQDALSAIEQYELRTKTQFLLSNGKSFKDYINARWASTKSSREASRARRSVAPLTNSRPSSTALSGPPGAPT